ncbi:type II toxin-antitoxin system VapC family toxin [Salmonirosea aquatica]|uniref:PIN domain-containing protein n=1 Tax=Salmonirosea aquatica TaxID=2654236 RepID=A0A7C9FCT4_9BACT|nr:PIN domain-containing protein [Cytophagaceae bacterium SJW1-29]
MNYLIDTHILIWHAEESHKLNPDVLEKIINPSNIIYVSHASFWEMTIKSMTGKLRFSTPVSEFQQLSINNDFLDLGFFFKHYSRLETLPLYHNDPFDRMLIAQAISEDLTLITQDRKFASYESLVPILWN